MATNHQQPLSVYQMVLDRVPFLLDDSAAIFAGLVVIARSGQSITIAGDYSPYLRKEITHTFNTPATAVVAGFSYDSGTNETTITYYMLLPSVVATNTVGWSSNFNEQLISRFILEMMTVVQSCYQIAPITNIGDEQYYNDLQKIVLAELTAYYIVFWATVGNAQGGMNAGGNSNLPTVSRYIKTAGADGISTTWEYLNIKSTAFLTMDAEKMMAQFKANAVCYGKQLGCQIVICDGAVACSCSLRPILTTPFIVGKRGGACRPYGRNGRC